MAFCKKQWKALLLLAVALLLGALLWWDSPGALSPLEQSLIGNWCTDYGPPRGAWVLELKPDRTCESRRPDGSQVGMGLTSLPGKWRVKRGSLVLDWRTGSAAVTGLRIIPSGRSLGSIELSTLDWAPGLTRAKITALAQDEFTLQYADRTLDTHKRLESVASR